MDKKLYVIVVFLILVFSFVSAQLGGIETQLEGTVDKLEENVDKIKEFTEKDKWDFIGSQWKEMIFKNKFIVGIDSLFTKIDLFFIIVFGMHWSLSIQMLFAILIAISVLLCLKSYIFFTNSNGMKWIYSFLAVLLLARINLFENLGNASFKLMFYKASILWKTSIFIGVIILLVLWFKLNEFIAKRVKEKEKKEKEKKMELNQKKTENFIKEFAR